MRLKATVIFHDRFVQARGPTCITRELPTTGKAGGRKQRRELKSFHLPRRH